MSKICPEVGMFLERDQNVSYKRVSWRERGQIPVCRNTCNWIRRNKKSESQGHVCRITKVTFHTEATRHKLFKPHTAFVDLNEISP